MLIHLQEFAKRAIKGESDAYLFSLWIAYKSLKRPGRLSDRIKEKLSDRKEKILDIDIKKHRINYFNILNKLKPAQIIETSTPPRLGRLRARNFRGFGCLNDEDKGTQIIFNEFNNIFYAPNGGGKTSLCEAIEFQVTGSIKESIRRKEKIADYIRRGEGRPTLSLHDIHGEIFPKTVALSSCFIDRNRLQEFSLLGSKDTKFEQGDVLALLLGLEDLDELIRRFVQPVNFNLNSIRLQSHQDRLTNLDQAIRLHSEGRRSAQEEILTKKSYIAELLDLSVYTAGGIHLRRNYFNALLKHREKKLLEAVAESKIHIMRKERIAALFRKIRHTLEQHQKAKATLIDNASSVHYEAIYNAIERFGEAVQEKSECPACLTSLDKTTTNPFQTASAELQKLQSISSTNTRIRTLEKSLASYLILLRPSVQQIEQNKQEGVDLEAYTGYFLVNTLKECTANVEHDTTTIARFLEALNILYLEHKEAIDKYCDECLQQFERRALASAGKVEAQTRIGHLRDKITLVDIELNDLRQLYRRLKAENNSLYAEIKNRPDQFHSAQREIRFNSFLSEVQAQYKKLYTDLIEYKVELECSKLSGIEKKAAAYYQAINDHDDDSEKIESIAFVKTDSSYIIELLCKNRSTLNAFSCLSEGHLRSLGLSLLLALAEKHRYPFIVFDDVVNAIDSEHRANIIALFFSDPYLSSTQKIITTHDRLFWERYCNSTQKLHGTSQLASRVLKHTNRGIVLVEYNVGFEDKIGAALEISDIRQALIYCRIWLETMTLQFCTSRKISVTAEFSDRQHHRQGNLLEISLEKIYEIAYAKVINDQENINLLKRDLIYWKAQNQEHHAFEENSFNFAHAKTSSEISNIVKALHKLDLQLNAKDRLEELRKRRMEAAQKHATMNREVSNPIFLEKAPNIIVQEKQRLLKEHEKTLTLLESDIIYAERFLDGP